jgi:hypothetical protein
MAAIRSGALAYAIASVRHFEERASDMTTFWLLLGLALLVVIGNALILLRTSGHPKPPATAKPEPDDNDDESDW